MCSSVEWWGLFPRLVDLTQPDVGFGVVPCHWEGIASRKRSLLMQVHHYVVDCLAKGIWR
jgi:hypothetical protein